MYQTYQDERGCISIDDKFLAAIAHECQDNAGGVDAVASRYQITLQQLPPHHAARNTYERALKACQVIRDNASSIDTPLEED